MSISVVLLILAGILVLIDLILGVPAIGRRTWFLTPIAVLLVITVLLITGGAVHA